LKQFLDMPGERHRQNGCAPAWMPRERCGAPMIFAQQHQRNRLVRVGVDEFLGDASCQGLRGLPAS
jgi:hypothetical protein